MIRSLLLLSLSVLLLPAAEEKKKNVLWIYLEDVSGWFSCYGDKVITTPNIDALAAEGIRFDRFYTSAGVCSAMRSASPRAGKKPSPRRAARRAAPFTWPPTTIGTPPGCTGLGFDSTGSQL